MRRLLIGLFSAAALTLLAVSVAWAVGELTQKPGAAGCVTDAGGACTDGNALQGAAAAVVSPDGKNVYVTAFQADGVAIFDRDPSTGQLTQKAGQAGCWTDAGGACSDGNGMNGAGTIAISPDGKHVYVGSELSSSIAVFSRDLTTGALTQTACLGGAAGCTAVPAPMSTVRSVTSDPEGKHVYVAAQGSDSVVAFDRDAGTGALTYKACSTETASPGCTDLRALNGAEDVDVSPDGKHVLVTSVDSSAVAVLDRGPDGVLTQRATSDGCISQFGSGGTCTDTDGRIVDPFALDISPDGKNAYLTVHGIHDSLVTLSRDTTTGTLTYVNCTSKDGGDGACADGHRLSVPRGVDVSPDGKSVYVASTFGNAVVIFDRDPTTGLATQKSGSAGCVAEVADAGVPGDPGQCQDGQAFGLATGVAVAPGSGSVYVASSGSHGVAILDRSGGTNTTTTTGTTTTTTPTGTTTTGTTSTPSPAPAPGPPAPVVVPRPPAVTLGPLPKGSAFVTLPSARRCVSRRRLRVSLKLPRGARVRGAEVFVKGRRKARRTAADLKVPINLTGLPKGTFPVKIDVTLADGRKVTQTRTYRTCAPKRKKKARG